MDKDFDKWNEEKKVLEKRKDKFFFKEREVWWCSLGVGIGEEACGKGEFFRRPVLIVKKLSQTLYLGMPISTQPKVGSWFAPVTIRGEIQTVLLYQLRMLSTQRLERRITTLDEKEFFRVKKKLEILLELFPENHRRASSGSVGHPKNNYSIRPLLSRVNTAAKVEDN